MAHTALQQAQQEHASRIYTQYLPMAHSLAAMFALRLNLDFSVVRDEALETLGMIACGWELEGNPFSGVSPTHSYKFNGKKGGECGWVRKSIYWDLMTFCSRKQGKAKPFSQFGDGEEGA